MFAVVLGCVFCNLSTAACLSERKRACTGTLQHGQPDKKPWTERGQDRRRGWRHRISADSKAKEMEDWLWEKKRW